MADPDGIGVETRPQIKRGGGGQIGLGAPALNVIHKIDDGGGLRPGRTGSHLPRRHTERRSYPDADGVVVPGDPLRQQVRRGDILRDDEVTVDLPDFPGSLRVTHETSRGRPRRSRRRAWAERSAHR